MRSVAALHLVILLALPARPVSQQDEDMLLSRGLLTAAGNGAAQDLPAMARADRVRLAEAFRLASAVGDRLWPGWERAPFAVLLVTPEHEYLVRHPAPSGDFARIGYDSLLGSDVYVRPRAQRPDLLATFPAIAGSPIATIVVGRAEQTAARTSTPWVVTLLHEHFHQLQYSQPTYYANVAALGLSRGDQTGMWMLTFPFPYDRPDIRQEFARLSRLLAVAHGAARVSDRQKAVRDYLEARDAFRAALSPDDYRYFGFQLWQEGIARYTEYHVASVAASGYEPSADFAALPDFTPYAQVAEAVHQRILRGLAAADLAGAQRVAFYAFGAAEGLLLDQVKPEWRSRYLVDKFDLAPYYASPR